MAMAAAGPEGKDVDPASLPSFPYRIYILVLLTLISAVSAIDRQVIDILIEPIRQEFGLTDRDAGALNGAAYAIPFAIAAIPLARLADRFSRKTVIAVSILIWSTATALCAFGKNFGQLFAARAGVGLGEAGLSSPGPALLSDIFPRKARGTVTSLYMLGPPIGIGVAYALGGWVLEHYGWRSAFLVAAIPGFVIAPVIYFTVRNIPKGLADGVRKEQAQPSLLKTFKAILTIPTLVYMICGLALMGIFTSGVQRWIPAFLQRTQGLEAIDYGAQLGAAVAMGNFIGHLAGGPLADVVGRKDMRLQFVIALMAVTGSVLVNWFLFTTDDLASFYILAGFQAGFAGLFAAPLIMICTTLPPVWARATTAALTLMTVYLIGFGLGPGIIGWVSDLLVPSYGEESLRQAVLLLLLLAIPSALFFLLAARHYRTDLARADAALAQTTE